MSGVGVVSDEYENDEDVQPSSSGYSPVKGRNVPVVLPTPGFSGGQVPSGGKKPWDYEATAVTLSFSSFLPNAANDDNQFDELPPPTPTPIEQVSSSDEGENDDVVDGNLEEKQYTELENPPLTPGTTNITDEVLAREFGAHDEHSVKLGESADNQTYSQQVTQSYPLDGWASPISSQGSAESVEFLFKNKNGIEINAAKVNGILQTPFENVLPKEIYKLIENYFDDKHGVKRFHSFFVNDLLPTALYTGRVQKDSKEADMIEKQLESLDKTALLGALGRVLLEKFSSRVGDQQQVAQPLGDVVEMETDIPSDPPPGRQLCNEMFQEGQSSSSVITETKVKTENPPSVPAFIPPAVGANKRKKKPTDGVCETIANISDEIWQNANDLRMTNQNPDKQLEKIGQVFFDTVLTKDEIKNCKLGGKTGKRFPIFKIRIIRHSVAFVLSKPTKLTTNAFKKAYNANALEDLLTNQQFEVIKKKVLTEYAYRQRKKLKEAIDQDVELKL